MAALYDFGTASAVLLGEQRHSRGQEEAGWANQEGRLGPLWPTVTRSVRETRPPPGGHTDSPGELLQGWRDTPEAREGNNIPGPSSSRLCNIYNIWHRLADLLHLFILYTAYYLLLLLSFLLYLFKAILY